MTPSWKFRTLPRPEHTAPPFYMLPWPDDLPGKCGVCGTEFRFGFNLSIGPGKAGRILRSIAYWGFLPFIGFGFLVPWIYPEFYSLLSGQRGSLLVFAPMFLPSFLLAGLSVVTPRTRLVECKKCGWSHDYKIRKPKLTGSAAPESDPSNARTNQVMAPREKPPLSIPILRIQTATMRNWKFRNVPGKYSAHPWPDDVPSQCGACGTKFRSGFNLNIGSGRMGRILRNSAYFGFLPCMALAFVVPIAFPDAFAQVSDKGLFAWLVGAMLLPPMILAGLAMAMPQSRRVECKECGWSHDYKIRKPEPLPRAS